MKSKYLLVALCFMFVGLLAFSQDNERRIKIAIIDSGLDVNDPRFSDHICGYEDFTGTGIEDNMGHGTHIAGSISKYISDKYYCFIILKYVDPKLHNTDISYNLAMKALLKYRPDVVNISGGGESYNEQEYKIIKKLRSVFFIVAAGNFNQDIHKVPFYPAAYKLKNIIPVGALSKNKFKQVNSNYGEGVEWEVGENVDSTLPYSVNYYGHGKLTGSSMATSVYTGKFVNENF